MKVRSYISKVRAKFGLGHAINTLFALMVICPSNLVYGGKILLKFKYENVL